jgi:hypothetical protein
MMPSPRRTLPDPGANHPPTMHAPATFRGLPLSRGQQNAVDRFLEEARQRGQAPDARELARMLHDMLSPPLAESDDDTVPAELRELAERAAGQCQDGAAGLIGEEERLAAAESEAMKRG